jgi:riboflavin-specific deaminase-like protein
MPLDDAIPLCEQTWARLLARGPGAADLSPLYGPLLEPACAADGCFVLGRLAQSLDGRIATRSGASFWISGPEDLLHTHRLRALFDAVVVGAGTVRNDNPRLTTRHCAGPSPTRCVIDANRRLASDHHVFAHGGPPTLLFVADDADGPSRHGAAEIVRLPRAPDRAGLEIGALLASLAARGLRRVFVEGGGVTVSGFLAAGALDRLHVTVAPLVLGAGIPAFTLPCPGQPANGMKLSWVLHRLGDDLLFDIPLHRARPPACE